VFVPAINYWNQRLEPLVKMLGTNGGSEVISNLNSILTLHSSTKALGKLKTGVFSIPANASDRLKVGGSFDAAVTHKI